MSNHVDLMRAELSQWNIRVFERFVERFEDDIEAIAASVADAYEHWRAFDASINGNENRAYISGLIYGALSLHVSSTKLLIWGHLVPSGNTMRQVLEIIAMAFLASGPGLDFLERYTQGHYSTHLAIRDVIRHADRLNLDLGALEILKKSQKFYDNFSHPTLMTLGTLMEYDSGTTVFGASFDEGKIDAYEKEIMTRMQVAALFPNFIHGVRYNLGD